MTVVPHSGQNLISLLATALNDQIFLSQMHAAAIYQIIAGEFPGTRMPA
jgi:hypothetical protein